MARKLREEVEDGIHHVWARGNDRQAIFRSAFDRWEYLKTLELTVRRTKWRLLCYCLMENHIHLVVETPRANVGVGMQRLHGLYARDFNDRHFRSGHLFQGRFGSRLLTDDEQLWTVVRYVHRNPVEAGLCAVASEWKWSSHRAVLDGTAPGWLDRARLLSFFGTMGGDPARTYRELIDG